jgi:DNA-binding phage protein
MSHYRTIGEIEEEYLRNHPEEIDDYIIILFDDYADSGDASALLSSLQVVSQVKGVTYMEEVCDPSRKATQLALSENSNLNSNLKFASVNVILQAMGYCLAAQKMSSST